MSAEKKLHAKSGWAMLAVTIVALVAIIALFIWALVGMVPFDESGLPIPAPYIAGLIASIVLFIAWFIPVSGFFTLQPGQARVCILFGDYKGTVRDEGFRWANPFYSRSMGSNSATENATAEVISKSGLSLGKQIETATKATSALSTKVSVRARTLNGEI